MRRGNSLFPAKQGASSLPLNQRMAEGLGARVIRLDPVARAKILWHRVAQEWKDKAHAELLPLGLRLNEAVAETAAEVRKTSDVMKSGTIVVNVSSGTICAGLLSSLIEQGLTPRALVGVTSHRLNVEAKRRSIWNKALDYLGFGSSVPPSWFRLEVSDCEYSDACEEPSPFPCNPWYDRKAWQWLVYNVGNLAEPILFWNIGS